MVHLIADVGGTNLRLAAVTGSLRQAASALLAQGLVLTKSYTWADIGTLDAALEEFCAAYNLARPFAALTLAIAGPAFDHQAEFKLTNWATPFTRAQMGAWSPRVRIINDFAAQAAIIPYLTDQDLHLIKPGVERPGTKAVVGPGTGLGIAGLDASGQVLAGEGGNVTVPYLRGAPWAALEQQVSEGRLRGEDVFSGQGLENLYAAQTGARLSAQEISVLAHGGDAAATAAMDLFFDFAAVLCSDQALQYGAAGGVYLVGAIAMKNRDLLDTDRFAALFCDIRTHAEFLAEVPVYQVTKSVSGLAGVAAYEASRATR